jgi:hypothetical protein
MRFHRKFALTVACSATVIIAALGATAGASQAARQAGSPRLTWAKILAMTPAQVAALQNPLIAAGTPLVAMGNTMRSIYFGIALDTPGHAVDLYVTDPDKAAGLIAAAKRRAPGLDVGLIRVKRSAYSAAALTAATNRLIAASDAKRLPFPVYSMGQVDLGASLRLRVPDAARAKRLSQIALASLGGRSVAQLAGVRLTFLQSKPGAPMSRENDTAPFIGGDWLTNYAATCTAGISIENSSNRDFLITANHCFPSGSTVFTQNGTTAVGIPYRYNENFDAELIDTGKYNGAGAQADEGESDTSGGGIKWYPLTGNAPPFMEQRLFCQDGISSWNYRRVVQCNFSTGTTADYICGQNGPCVWVPEMVLQSQNQTPAVIDGDSGGVVFTVASATTRDAAGMVSYGNGCTYLSATNHTLQCTEMDFVWYTNLYNDFGFTGRLNPHS